MQRGDARPWVLAFLHGQQMALLRWPRRRRTAALVSLSSDGQLQSGALRVAGLEVHRGSTSRSGARGLAAIVRALRRGLDAAFAVDGPRGPLGVVHPGAIAAARHVGGVIVPLASACARCLVLERAWDHFEIPWPFSRVVVVSGAPIDPGADDETARRLAASLTALRAEALRRVGRATAPTLGQAGGA